MVLKLLGIIALLEKLMKLRKSLLIKEYNTLHSVSGASLKPLAHGPQVLFFGGIAEKRTCSPRAASPRAFEKVLPLQLTPLR